MHLRFEYTLKNFQETANVGPWATAVGNALVSNTTGVSLIRTTANPVLPSPLQLNTIAWYVREVTFKMNPSEAMSGIGGLSTSTIGMTKIFIND